MREHYVHCDLLFVPFARVHVHAWKVAKQRLFHIYNKMQKTIDKNNEAIFDQREFTQYCKTYVQKSEQLKHGRPCISDQFILLNNYDDGSYSLM